MTFLDPGFMDGAGLALEFLVVGILVLVAADLVFSLFVNDKPERRRR